MTQLSEWWDHILQLLFPSHYIIINQKIYRVQLIDQGATGFVYRAAQQSNHNAEHGTKKSYAIKKINIETEEMRQSYYNEVKYLQAYKDQHEYILQCIGHEIKDNWGYVVMPFYEARRFRPADIT